MGTNYSEIYSLFVASIKDYKIDKLFRLGLKNQELEDLEIEDIDPEIEEIEEENKFKEFEDYVKPFLIKGLINFKKCKKDLEDRDDTTQVFNETLSTEEKVILSNLMLVEWLTKEVNDILQMKLHLQDSDFKTFSSAQNLREKSVHLNNTREVVDKQITQYGYNNLDWTVL